MIFVCLADNNSTTTPNNDSTNWAAAGSKDFPFQTKGMLAFAGIAPNGFPAGSSAEGELSLNEYDTSRQNKAAYPSHPTNFAYEAAGPGGTIIFGDGDYATPTGAAGNSFGAANVTLKSLNFQKATLLNPYGFTVSGGKGPGQSNGPLVIDGFIQYRTYHSSGATSSDSTNTVTFRDCYITDQHPQSTYQNDATSNTSNGGAVSNVLTEFTFFYNCSIIYKRYYVNYLCYSGVGNAENCTFYVQVASGNTGYSLFNFHTTTKPVNLKNCIVYVKHFYKNLSTNAFFGNTPAGSLDEVSWFIENNYTGTEIQAGSAVSYSDDLVRNIDPLFIDAENSNFALRPSSQLIGGLSETSSRYRLYVTAAEKAGPASFDTPSDNASFYRFSGYSGSKFLTGMRTSYGGEIYECILDHDYDSTQDPSSDSTNWRLVEGTINDPYKSCDFNDYEGTINNKLTNNHDLILLDGDYNYFPITSDSSYPTTSPTLKSLNKHKVIIFQSNFRPAGFITKDLTFENSSLSTSGYTHYPLDGRVGFHVENCVIHSGGTWWPPLNSVVKNCLIFQDLSAYGMFYGSFGQSSSTTPTDKAITFIQNTVIFNGSLSNGSILTSLINQGNFNAIFKDNIFYVKPGFTGSTNGWTLSAFSHPELVFENNVAFDENDVIVNDLRGLEYIDPKFINNNGSSIEDFRLRPDSPLIGGIKKDPSNVYYLQPGNTYNGDGSQKDASSMTADGEPGPFNNFKEIVAAGVPYGSTIIIVNGTYAWPNNFHTRKSASTWETLTYEGYNYKAETRDKVIFDANKQGKFFGYQPYGGTAGSGTYLDLDTSFEGIQFNNVMGGVEGTSRNQIFTASSSAGFGSCTFNSCKFLGWINTTTGPSYPWTGGGRNQYGSTMHWKGCTIVIAFDDAGSLFGGGDGFADDAYHGPWSWENCTFYIPVGLTTFNGRNAANGTYQSPGRLFGSGYNQSQRTFKNNILYIPGGNTSTGTTSVNNLPVMQNNCLVGVVPEAAYFDFVNDNNIMNVDPKFVGHADNDFSLRPSSPLIGRG